MKKIYIYIISAIALVVFILMMLMLSPSLNIKNIKVNGLKLLKENDIIRELKLDKETNILSINSIVAKRRLKENYYVKNVSITYKFPDTININITERNLVGYISNAGNYIYIDDEGFVVDIKNSFIEPLPVIYGIDFQSFIIGKKVKVQNEEDFLVLMEITKFIKEKQNLKKINKIDISNLDDIHLYMENMDINLGGIEAISIKMNTLDEILKKFTPQEKGILYINDINKSPIFKYIT